MEQLSKISINNIRRFSDDVTIDISEGATIFYAPNGTGKTSIFEAIELALTGSVKRLSNNFSPLIRESCKEASVRLDFKSGKYCEVQLAHGSTPILTGDHSSLFSNTPLESVPYLLRLTHLLNQRGDGWFVQSQSTSAGAQLDYLSIGREATQANKVITSAKKAATFLKNNIQRELDEARQSLSNWVELLSNRDGYTNRDPNRPLIPLISLFESIYSIFQLYVNEEIIFVDDIHILKSQKSEVFAALLRKKEEVLQKSIILQNIQNTITEYSEEKRRIIEFGRRNTTLREFKKSTEAQINKLNISLRGEISILELLEFRHKETMESHEQLQRFFSLRQNLEDTLAQIDIAQKQFDSEDKHLALCNNFYKIAMELSEKHQMFFERGVALGNKRSALQLQQDAIDKWHNYTVDISNLQNQLSSELISSADKDRERIEKLIIQRELSKLNLNETQQTFDALNASSDSIRSAIGVIVSQLPNSRGDCPVCTQQYEPSELQSRMLAALNAINPELIAIASKIERIKNDLNENSKKIKELNLRHSKLSGFINNIRKNIALNHQLLSQLINNNFPGINSIDIAEKHLQDDKDQNEAAFFILEKNIANELPAPSLEELAVLKSNVNIAEKNKLIANERLNLLTHQLYKLSDDNEMVPDVSLENFEEISRTIAEVSTDIEEQRGRIALIRNDIKRYQGVLQDATDDLDFAEKQYHSLVESANQYKLDWMALGIQEDPSTEAIVLVDKYLALERNKIDFYVEELNKVDNEISRWIVYDDYTDIRDRINVIAGVLSESEYTSELTAHVNSLSDKLSLVESKSSTLSTFSANLSSQLDRVNELIDSVNPLWNKLLKRIIVDPRFSETVLKSYSHYKKQHADVNVQLHGKEILASHVASEAQITDLQLTFLLALAQNYKWMPWRALLLDDPTQHHDLVHASAVFDLLRDYIAENSFQVLLATHDSMQAKFFMRKLENDGIPAHLCALQATAHGVKAAYH